MTDPESALDRLARGAYHPEDKDDIPRALTSKVVAGALGMNIETLWAQVRTGRFPLQALRVGGGLRFRRDDLLTFLLGPVESESVPVVITHAAIVRPDPPVTHEGLFSDCVACQRLIH